MPVVEHILRAERARHRQVVRLDEALQVVTGGLGPAGSAGNDDRALGSAQQTSQPGDLHVRRGRLDRLMTQRVGHVGDLRLHVLGQGQHDRSRATAGRHLERARDELRDARCTVDLRNPLDHRTEHAAVVDLLECLTLGELVADLADEQDHRCGVLERGMDADRRVGGTGAARDERHARLAGQLRVGIGHEGRARLVARDDQLDHLARVVQRIEHGDVAFARNAERVIDALDQQLVDEDAGAGARGHAGVTAGKWSRRIAARAHRPSRAAVGQRLRRSGGR